MTEKEKAIQELSELKTKLNKLESIINYSEQSGPITDRVKTFEDVCAILGRNIVINSDDTKDEIAYKKLKLIARALNEGWEPKWDDGSERKYYPWFKMGSGFGSSRYDCDFWDSHSYVGSRLCFKSSELAIYAGKQFSDIYKEYLTIQK